VFRSYWEEGRSRSPGSEEDIGGQIQRETRPKENNSDSDSIAIEEKEGDGS